MKTEQLLDKNIFWIVKNADGKVWNEGYVHKIEGNMILIGINASLVSELYHSNWYEIKDLKIKVRK